MADGSSALSDPLKVPLKVLDAIPASTSFCLHSEPPCPPPLDVVRETVFNEDQSDELLAMQVLKI